MVNEAGLKPLCESFVGSNPTSGKTHTNSVNESNQQSYINMITGSITQQVECTAVNREVVGSNPTRTANNLIY